MSDTEDGRLPDGTGLSQAEPKVSAASGFDPSREEFCKRFKEYMLSVAGPTFDDGDSIAEYAEEAAVAYWEDEEMRCEGPEECASADISYWGQ